MIDSLLHDREGLRQDEILIRIGMFSQKSKKRAAPTFNNGFYAQRRRGKWDKAEMIEDTGQERFCEDLEHAGETKNDH